MKRAWQCFAFPEREIKKEDECGRATERRVFDASCLQDNTLAENGHVLLCVCVCLSMSLNNKTWNSFPAGGCPLTSEPVSDRSCDPACDKPRSYCTEVSMCACLCLLRCDAGMPADCKQACMDIQYSRIRLPPEERVSPGMYNGKC